MIKLISLCPFTYSTHKPTIYIAVQAIGPSNATTNSLQINILSVIRTFPSAHSQRIQKLCDCYLIRSKVKIEETSRMNFKQILSH